MRTRRKSGEVFGRLTVRTRMSASPNKNPLYEGTCSCGALVYVLGSALSAKGPKSTRSCGCAQRESARRPPGQVAYTQLYLRYIKNADERGHRFQLTREQFKFLVAQACTYCGTPPAPYNPYIRRDGTLMPLRSAGVVARAWVNVNGIDRRDNDVGYTLDNCVPCCGLCNYGKLDYTAQEYIDHCYRVVTHQEEGKHAAINNDHDTKTA